jgi:two-component system CheB/CheR fusion protein
VSTEEIADAVRVPLVVLDHRLRVQWVNRIYRETFAATADTIGAGWLAIDGGIWNAPGLRAALDQLIARGQDVTLDVEVEAPPGRRRTVAVTGSLVGAAGESRRVLLSLLDITERVERMRRLEGACAAAEAANHTKDVFLATLSHELRVPLHTITLQADLLQSGAAPGPTKARRVATAISQAARAQEQIISDLLDVSAVVAGKMVLKRQPVDMTAVVSAAVSGIRAAAGAKQIRVRVGLDRSCGLVVGDPTRLQQIIANLLSNAVKYTEEGGQVSVRLDRSEGAVRVRVSDTGQGIAPELLGPVFDRFVQGEQPDSPSYGGLGLGLTIVRDLVRLHQGTVWAESPGPGEGATFTVELPTLEALAAAGQAGERDEAERGEAAALPHEDLKGIRVLIVEDDPSSRDVLTDILRFRSAEVMAVSSAAEVMEALQDFHPDVMLCDVAMPGEDGYSLMRRVRSLEPEKGGSIPAVALTALATKRDRRRALTAGFHLHVAKPTPASELCQAVRDVYDQAHQPRSRM